MSKNSEKVKRWRKKSKDRIVEAMGGKCCICGYNKCNSVLSLHHLDPSIKEFTLGAIRANPKSWTKIVEELRKCVLVCYNCHIEVHSGVAFVPEDAPKFNEKFADYKNDERQSKLNNCPICNTLKHKSKKYCSIDCMTKGKVQADWTKIDIVEELKIKSITQLSEELGFSSRPIYNRLKKLNLTLKDIKALK